MVGVKANLAYKVRLTLHRNNKKVFGGSFKKLNKITAFFIEKN